jgi:branched-subunit amino acid aminotransferase/4-amino-4-deoxychorismate lyase
MEQVSQLNRGMAYGESCFETFRVIHGAVFALRQHQQRLAQSAACFGWQVDASALCQQAIDAAMAQYDDALVRITLSGDTAPWGLLPAATTPRSYLQLMASTARKPCHLYSIDCGDIILRPRQHKLAADYATMLMLYHRAGSLADGGQPLWCTSHAAISTMTANVVCLIDGRWCTPRQEDGVLSGIVRAHLLAQGAITACCCERTAMARCQAMACINSGIMVQAVQSLDARMLDVRPQTFEPLYAALRHQHGVPPL